MNDGSVSFEKIDETCSNLEGSYKHFCSSFLVDILNIVNSVKCFNTDLEDFFVNTPMFTLYHSYNTAVAKLFLCDCSFEFRRRLRYKLGHAFERIFSLDHVVIYSNRVTFFTVPFFENDK